MSCKLQTENISNILCNYLIYVLHITSYFWADLAIFQYNLSVPVYCIDPIYSIYLFAISSLCRWTFLPTNATVTCIALFIWYRVPCNGGLSLSLVNYNNFIPTITTSSMLVPRDEML